MSMRVVLGSTSPRRRTILGALFPTFEVIAPDADETLRHGEAPADFAARLSADKCRSVAGSGLVAEYPSLVITADTIVTIDGRVIGKPADFDEAVGILSDLVGRTHLVITAVSLLPLTSRGAPLSEPFTAHETTAVTFRDLDRAGILRYLGAIDWHDKAGAYAFQENGRMIIAGWEGSATNIIGFPLRLFFAMAAGARLLERLF